MCSTFCRNLVSCRRWSIFDDEFKNETCRRFKILFLKNKKNVIKNAHLRAVEIAITTFYQTRTRNFGYTDSGWDWISYYFDPVWKVDQWTLLKNICSVRSWDYKKCVLSCLKQNAKNESALGLTITSFFVTRNGYVDSP